MPIWVLVNAIGQVWDMCVGVTRLPAGTLEVHVRPRNPLAGKRKGTAGWPCLHELRTGLLLLVVVLFRLYAAILSGLGFRFFHRLLGLCSLLGAGFSAFFTLLVQHLLAAKEFEER